MKKVKRTLAKVILMAIIFTMYPVQGTRASTRFPDVPTTAWYMDDLQYILKDPRKIFAGYPDGTFKPNDTLTVDMYIKLIVTVMGHQVENGKEYWASTYIEKAIEEGYIVKGDDLFMRGTREDPYSGYKRPIARKDMAQITGRALDKITEESEYRDPLSVSGLIKDYNSIQNSYCTNVVKCYDLGILTGFPDGEFKPDNVLTRAEAVAVIRRLIDPGARKRTPLPVVANPSPTPIPVAELNRPAKKDLGNGVVEVEGIRFDPAEDTVGPRGAMEILKAQEFLGVFLDHLVFYEHNGKARVRGYLPELPEGFVWKLSLLTSLEKPDDRGLWGVSLGTTDGFSPEQTLPKAGQTFDRPLFTNKENFIALVLISEIYNTSGSHGGRIWISFTQKKYVIDDRFGGHDASFPFDAGGFFEW